MAEQIPIRHVGGGKFQVMGLRSFRIPDPLYFAARDKARAEGTDLAKIVREKLTEYVEDGDD